MYRLLINHRCYRHHHWISHFTHLVQSEHPVLPCQLRKLREYTHTYSRIYIYSKHATSRMMDCWRPRQHAPHVLTDRPPAPPAVNPWFQRTLAHATASLPSSTPYHFRVWNSLWLLEYPARRGFSTSTRQVVRTLRCLFESRTRAAWPMIINIALTNVPPDVAAVASNHPWQPSHHCHATLWLASLLWLRTFTHRAAPCAISASATCRKSCLTVRSQRWFHNSRILRMRTSLQPMMAIRKKELIFAVNSWFFF